MRRRHAPLLLLLLPLVAAFAASCGGDDGGGGEISGKLRVVTTVSPITSIAENIGGDRIELEGIIPEGMNSHTYEPPPSVARTLATADLIVLNGLSLEEPTLELAEANKKEGAVILLLGDNAITREQWKFDFSFPESEGKPNPHLWPDPMLALRYAELIRDQLVSLDPENADYYDENLAKFRERIEDLDRRIREAIATIPPEHRKLLTYHDSWAYFAERYGMQVIGAVQPSDFSEPSAREVASLIDQIRREGVPAVFGSEVFPSDVLETIAREAGAQFIDKLRDDDLPGAPGDPDHSYLGLMVENMRTMIPALGGDASAFDGFDTGPVFSGQSTAKYPQ
ncbi:MAG TPA: metal ABC transporter substrate-binding protein [Dehalococcoidia bacterium]|nr:metal ABC transporter substrate-binding protein [Dehalococcoidia bacterium]